MDSRVRGRRWSLPRRGAAVAMAVAFLGTGCGTMYPRYLGIRPDSPDLTASDTVRAECRHRHGPDDKAPLAPADRALLTACENYLNHVDWARQLAESYRTRATMNEWAIYAGGIVALGALSAVSGLGLAAAASTTTIGLIGVSSGFTSGVLAFVDNKTRAGFYTVAANNIAAALAQAETTVGSPATPTSYRGATVALTQAVTAVVIDLESTRYQAAAMAASAKQVENANKRLEEAAGLAATAAVVGIEPTSAPDATKPTPASLTLTGIDDPAKYQSRLRVLVDGVPVAFTIDSGKIVAIMPRKPEGKTRVNVVVHIDALPLRSPQTFGY